MVPDPGYSKDELLGYVEHCRKKLTSVMAGMTEAWVAGACPFPHRAMSNGELLLYNLRHVQHHAAQLNMQLRQATNSAPKWVSKGGQNIQVVDPRRLAAIVIPNAVRNLLFVGRSKVHRHKIARQNKLQGAPRPSQNSPPFPLF